MFPISDSKTIKVLQQLDEKLMVTSKFFTDTRTRQYEYIPILKQIKGTSSNYIKIDLDSADLFMVEDGCVVPYHGKIRKYLANGLITFIFKAHLYCYSMIGPIVGRNQFQYKVVFRVSQILRENEIIEQDQSEKKSS